MRAVIQRVSRASVRADGRVVGEIAGGLLVLLGVAASDEAAHADGLAGKVARLRIFENDEGRFDSSVLDAGGAVLAVSQFTLIADHRRPDGSARPEPGRSKGNRPDFSGAARPEVAEPLYERFVATLRTLGVPVETGLFGARMEVELVNDGPVTLVLDV